MTQAVTLAGLGSTTPTIVSPTLTSPVLGTPVSGSLVNCTDVNYTGFKNRIINGDFRVAQRGASIVVPTGLTINYYTMDRWIVNTNSLMVTCVQPTYGSMQITSAAGANTSITCFQRIEANNSYSLAGNTVTLSGLFATSEGVNVTWTAYYANTVNTFGTLISPTKTQIATGTFTTSGGGLSGTASFQVPLGATTGLEIAFSVTISGNNWVVLRNIQLEKGSVATSFDYRPYGTELSLCQRYYQGDILATVGGGATPTVTNRPFYCAVNFPVPFRASPTMTTLSTIVSSNMNAGSWAQLDASRGYFVATNSVTNDCALVVQCSGAAEL